MAELQKISTKLCKSCKYSTRINYFKGREVSIACDYIGRCKKSRIFEDGAYRIPPNMCDKYVPQKGRRKNGHEMLRDTELKNNKYIEEGKKC